MGSEDRIARSRRRSRGGILHQAAFGERGLLSSDRTFDERAPVNLC